MVIVKSLVWFALGIVGGFIAAHVVNKDPRGQEAFAQLDARIGEFTERMSDAYHDQETRLSDIIDDARAVTSSAADRVSDTVDHVAGTAGEAVSDAAAATKKNVSPSD